MRIGIYDPYLDTLGGGERYVLSIASYLSQNHQVNVFWDDKNILSNASEKFDLELKNVGLVHNIFSGNESLFKKSNETKKYDVVFYLSDGSVPWLMGEKNILLFQFPVNWVKGKSLANRIKFRRIYKIICYTNFVKKHLDRTFPKKSIVLYPAIEGIKNDKAKKEQVILNVGRFTKGMNTKKQDVLIKVFCKMVDDGLNGYKLILAGSYLPQDIDLVEDLKNKSKGYPIEIVENATFFYLSDLYRKAEIYWHAAGYGEDLDMYPERAEHFGITTVEAMSAGCVPVVFNGGGQPEVVDNNKNGFLWNATDELMAYTINLISDKSLMNKFSTEALNKSKKFNLNNFQNEIENIIK